MSETGKRLTSWREYARNHSGDIEVHSVDDRELLNPRGWVEAPRARDLPGWRTASVQCWEPGGPFTLAARLIKASSPEHAHDFRPGWERATMRDAQLWYVGAPMCDLLVGAAPAMPPLKLTAALMPDEAGFVFFEAPLAGIDADGTENTVSVGAYLWGRAMWEHPRTRKQRPVIGITVYGPGLMSKSSLSDMLGPVPLMPLGGLVWPFGETCDVQWYGGDPRDRSMSEDRRRLLALWLLSSQAGLTSNTVHQAQQTSKAKRKRIAAGKVQPDPPVRVVQLRRQPAGDRDAPERSAGGRTYRHRWTVSGHWRNQAFGPQHSLHRPLYINPYLKGPDTAPLLKSERVKAWTK